MDSTLQLNKKILKCVGLWPETGSKFFRYIQMFLIYGAIYICGYTCFVATCRQIIYGIDDLSGFVECGYGVFDIGGFIYIKYCFIKKIQPIKRMILTIQQFRRFCPDNVIEEAEKRAKKYTKALLAYAIIGNVLNVTMCIMDRKNCEEERSQYLQMRDPCGVPIRGHWPFDIESDSFLYWTIFYIDFHACVVLSCVAFVITTFLMACLVHTIAQLEHCCQLLKNSCEDDDETNAEDNVRICIVYHQKIIEFSEDINDSFNNQLLLHVTVTSFVISVLGFQILTINNFEHSFRFTLHLFGWTFFFYVTCFFAQKLIDKSLLIGLHAYSTPWYRKSSGVRRMLMMVIMRSQKPLKLCALNLGVLSSAMFLTVMKSAYSYFTLLLNLRH